MRTHHGPTPIANSFREKRGPRRRHRPSSRQPPSTLTPWMLPNIPINMVCSARAPLVPRLHSNTAQGGPPSPERIIVGIWAHGDWADKAFEPKLLTRNTERRHTDHATAQGTEPSNGGFTSRRGLCSTSGRLPLNFSVRAYTTLCFLSVYSTRQHIVIHGQFPARHAPAIHPCRQLPADPKLFGLPFPSC